MFSPECLCSNEIEIIETIRTIFLNEMKNILNKLVLNFKKGVTNCIFIYPSVLKYKFLSDCKIFGKYNSVSPVLIKGRGKVFFGSNVNFGVFNSPYYFNSHVYIEARNESSIIVFGDNVYINNNACIISEAKKIVIGNNVLIGSNFTVYDSDFHDLNPVNRFNGSPKVESVYINSNVFIGSSVTVLKGVTIGENSVIASCSVVTKSIPPNVIAGGNPCKIIRFLVNQ